MTIFLEKAMPFDLRTLRSFRCLRPLKMVSKVPSKLNDQLKKLDMDIIEDLKRC